MSDININYVNVQAKVDEIQQYIDTNILDKAKADYKMLEELLNEMEGSFTNELSIVLAKEKATVYEYIKCLKEIYRFVGEATEGFREVDEQSASVNRF